jgi:hypothetical protein
MKRNWTEGPSGAVTVRSPFNAGGMIFGAGLALIGLYLFYNLVFSGIDCVQSLGKGSFEFVPGFLFLLFLTACFLLPGAALLLLRKTVTVDPARAGVTEATKILFWGKSTEMPFSALAKLTARWEALRSSNSRDSESKTVYVCLVEFLKRDGEKLLVSQLTQEERAVELARLLSSRSGIVFENLCPVTTQEEDEEESS